MGFWQGVANAYSDIRSQRREERLIEEDRKLQKEALMEDREYQRQLREEDRAFDREMLMTRLAEDRRKILLERSGSSSASSPDADALVGKTMSVASRLGEAVNTEIGQRLISNPALAAQLEDWVVGTQEEFAKKGYEPPLFEGENLIELLEVHGLPKADPQGGVTTSSIFDMTFEELLAVRPEDLPSQTPQDYLRITPVPMPDPKVLEEGRDMFGRQVLRLAQEELQNMPDDAASHAKLQALVDSFDLNNPNPQTEALINRFGKRAYDTVSQMDSPYIQSFSRDPLFQGVSAVPREAQELIDAINDPNAPADQVTQMRSILLQKFGIYY